MPFPPPHAACCSTHRCTNLLISTLIEFPLCQTPVSSQKNVIYLSGLYSSKKYGMSLFLYCHFPLSAAVCSLIWHQETMVRTQEKEEVALSVYDIFIPSVWCMLAYISCQAAQCFHHANTPGAAFIFNANLWWFNYTRDSTQSSLTRIFMLVLSL